MNYKEVIALRKAFNSVKERQNLNFMKDPKEAKAFLEMKQMLKISRELCVGNEELLKKVIDKLKNNGIDVHIIKEKQDAIDFILEEIGHETVAVKSKSNVTKELELTKILEKRGINVIETDIGDRILQILDAHPSHPTGPVSHLSAKEIAKGLSIYYKRSIDENPDEIVKIIREDVISSINKSKIGITGANAITADEGSILMTHNEGNIHEVMRKEKHIIVTSIDKVYPNIESAINMIKILSYNATGSKIPSFVDIISGMSKTADVEKKFIKGVHNPSKIVLLLLDNKRSELIENGFKELLQCIGCGNCLIHCPMYNTIGNEYAIDNYLGGKGIAYYSICNDNNDKRNNIDINNPINRRVININKLELCLTCGKCKENCPLEIDIPDIIKKIRSKGVSSDIYYFLKSHMIWIYYQLLLKSKFIT